MKTARVSEVCKLVNGGTPKSGVTEYWGGDVAWLTPAEMGKRSTPYIAETARTISQIGLANCSARQVPVGAVIMSTRAPIGHLAIPEIPMTFNQGCRGLIPNEALDTKYLYYFLWFSREALNELGTGATFKELSSSALGNYRIPLPPLEEQRRIVAVLDEAFAAIATATANAEKNLANSRELFELVSGKLFETAEAQWGEVELAEISQFQGGSQPPKSTFLASPQAGYVRLLQIRDFKSDKAAVYIPESKRNKLCREDDVMIARYGASVGQIHRGKAGAYNVALIRTIPDEQRIDKDYFYHFLQSPRFQVPLMAVASRSAQDGFSKEDIAPIRVPLPPIDEQRRLIAELLQLDRERQRLAELYHAKSDALVVLKQALLHRAFAGELTAAVPEALAA